MKIRAHRRNTIKIDPEERLLNEFFKKQKMDVNEKMVLLFFIMLTLWGIGSTVIEYVYYMTTICKTARNQVPAFWVSVEVIVTTLARLSMLSIMYMDLKYKYLSFMKVGRPLVVPLLVHGAISSSLMPIHVYDFTKCKSRHWFLSLKFSYYFIVGVVVFDILVMLVFTILIAVVKGADVKLLTGENPE